MEDRVNQGEKPNAKTKLNSLYRFTDWLKKKKYIFQVLLKKICEAYEEFPAHLALVFVRKW